MEIRKVYTLYCMLYYGNSYIRIYLDSVNEDTSRKIRGLSTFNSMINNIDLIRKDNDKNISRLRLKMRSKGYPLP